MFSNPNFPHVSYILITASTAMHNSNFVAIIGLLLPLDDLELILEFLSSTESTPAPVKRLETKQIRCTALHVS